MHSLSKETQAVLLSRSLLILSSVLCRVPSPCLLHTRRHNMLVHVTGRIDGTNQSHVLQYSARSAYTCWHVLSHSKIWITLHLWNLPWDMVQEMSYNNYIPNWNILFVRTQPTLSSPPLIKHLPVHIMRYTQFCDCIVLGCQGELPCYKQLFKTHHPSSQGWVHWYLCV